MATVAQIEGKAPARKRSVRKAQSRERLIAASCHLFLENGFEQTTIDQITAGAGLSRASFYLHFESKEAVIGAMIAQVGDSLRKEYEHLSRLGNANLERLAGWVASFVGACRVNRPIVFAIQRGTPGLFDEIGYYIEMMALIGRRIPRFAQAAGDDDPAARADAMLFFFELQSLVRYVSQVGLDLDEEQICLAVARRIHHFIHQRD